MSKENKWRNDDYGENLTKKTRHGIISITQNATVNIIVLNRLMNNIMAMNICHC